jgi:bile acid-coenzyme A ligase
MKLMSHEYGDGDLEDRAAMPAKAITSGGSTGRPKLILGGQPGVFLLITKAQSTWRMATGKAAVLPTPLYHTAEFTMLTKAVCVGAHLILSPRFDAESVLDQMDRFRANWAFLVPTTMRRIWKLPEQVRESYDLSEMKVLWHLAAPCLPWLKEAFISWFGGDVIIERYGGAEGQTIPRYRVMNG